MPKLARLLNRFARKPLGKPKLDPKSGYYLSFKLQKWRIRLNEDLPDIMSLMGKDYRRISGLAKPLVECKTEVRVY